MLGHEVTFDSRSISTYYVLRALGTFLSFISLMKYFQWFPNYAVLTDTLTKSATRVVKALLSIVPIFFGFGILGYLLFHNTQKYFGTFDR